MVICSQGPPLVEGLGEAKPPSNSPEGGRINPNASMKWVGLNEGSNEKRKEMTKKSGTENGHVWPKSPSCGGVRGG